MKKTPEIGRYLDDEEKALVQAFETPKNFGYGKRLVKYACVTQLIPPGLRRQCDVRATRRGHIGCRWRSCHLSRRRSAIVPEKSRECVSAKPPKAGRGVRAKVEIGEPEAERSYRARACARIRGPVCRTDKRRRAVARRLRDCRRPSAARRHDGRSLSLRPRASRLRAFCERARRSVRDRTSRLTYDAIRRTHATAIFYRIAAPNL